MTIKSIYLLNGTWFKTDDFDVYEEPKFIDLINKKTKERIRVFWTGIAYMRMED